MLSLSASPDSPYIDAHMRQQRPKTNDILKKKKKKDNLE